MDLKDYKHENDLYKQLADLKEAREFIKNAIHHNFYNRTVVDNLYVKFHDVNKKILEKIKHSNVVGIMAGASTPKESIEEAIEFLKVVC